MSAVKTFPDTLDVDDDGYPNDDRLQEIIDGDGLHPSREGGEPGALWLVETFPKLAEEMGYGHCDKRLSASEESVVLEYHTDGWSGCEDFIGAVTRNLALRVLYYAEWRRGGHYVFKVPLADLEPRVSKGSMRAWSLS